MSLFIEVRRRWRQYRKTRRAQRYHAPPGRNAKQAADRALAHARSHGPFGA